MAEFSKLVTTDGGRALLAALLAEGKQIEFTKVSTSDTVYEEAELAPLEVLTGIRQNGTVSKVTRATDTTVRIETVVTNAELTESYFIHTVGLYAKNKDGAEILYAAAVEKSGSCHMPAFAGTTVSGAYLNLITTVSNAENVSIQVSDSVYATIGDIKDLQEQIDGLRDMVEGNAALGELNGARLDALNRMGMQVYSQSFTVSFQNLQNRNAIIGFTAAENQFDSLDSNEIYIYTIDSLAVQGHITFDGGYRRNIQGFLNVSFRGKKSGLYYTYSQVSCPLFLSDRGEVSVSPQMMGIGLNKNAFNKFQIQLCPYLYTVSDSGTVTDLNEAISGTFGLNLTIAKIGYNLSGIHVGGEGQQTAGIRDYNVLNNKPSINSVILKGNLTP